MRFRPNFRVIPFPHFGSPRRRYFVRRSPHAVKQQLEKTLRLVGCRHSLEGDCAYVPNLRMTATVVALAGGSVLAFQFASGVGSKELYLIRTLVKYQRFA